MSFITSAKSQASQSAAVSGLQLQSSAYGKAIPIIYGSTRMAPNLIWYGDFVATPQASSGGGAGKGGGGGGGKSGSGGSYVYQTAVALGICEGPISSVGNVYLDKTVTTLSALGLSFFAGQYGQAEWGYLVSQSVAVSETHTIPASAPYAVAVNSASDFLADAGVTGNTPAAYARVGALTPGPSQYTVGLSGSNASYHFNAANAGAQVVITTTAGSGVTKRTNASIPAAAPFTILVALGSNVGFGDGGVAGVPLVFSATSGAPAAGQYAVSGGVYMFAAANAGGTVTIVYYTASGSPALGYSGTAYAAASAYQLGTSAQLPNHNLEVHGNAVFTVTLQVPQARRPRR